MEKTIILNVNLSKEDIIELFRVRESSEPGKFYRLTGRESGYKPKTFQDVLTIDKGTTNPRDVMRFLKGEPGPIHNVLNDYPVWNEELQKGFDKHQPWGIRSEILIKYTISISEMAIYVRFWDID